MDPTRYDNVSLHKVTRVFGATRALAGVTLTFRAGEVASVEGPNGAGKSTLLGVLSTLSRPTAGRVRWGDLSMPEDTAAIRGSLGLVAHEALVYPDLTPRENLRLLGALHDLDDPIAATESALEAVGLTSLADRPARTFSRGQMQRLALARATLHDPQLLLFDEPTTGLDQGATARLERAIAEARRRGCIVVLVTHDLGFAARVADVRVQIVRGKVEGIARVPMRD
jgi:heme exporter protein A